MRSGGAQDDITGVSARDGVPLMSAWAGCVPSQPRLQPHIRESSGTRRRPRRHRASPRLCVSGPQAPPEPHGSLNCTEHSPPRDPVPRGGAFFNHENLQ